jgi:hypothetical protein
MEEAAETETESDEKDLAVAGVAKIAMVVRYLWSVSGRAIRDLGTESIKWVLWVPTTVA